MRHIPALVIILLFVILPSCKLFKGRLFGGKSDTMAVWQARQDSVRVADSLQKAQNELLALENARLDSIRRVEGERLAYESKYKYNIIVGSFITPEFARDMDRVYKQRGYNSRIVKMEGSRFELVSAESCDSFKKAVDKLKEFQDTVELNSWLYIKR
jgi:hypothetical protein